MSVWAALGLGAFSSASLFIGQWLAAPLRNAPRTTGQVMGFGAGTMIAAVAYELVPESALRRGHDVGLGIAIALGALVYFLADKVIDDRGGSERQSIEHLHEKSSGVAMFLGALLDGIPESFVLGITLAAGGAVSVSFVSAVFVSNIPQGIAATTSLQEAGYGNRKITLMWTALTVVCAAVAAFGYVLASNARLDGEYSQAFAAGAVLAMLASSMMPEAFKNGGRLVALFTVFGYLVAAVLAIAG